MLHDLSVAIEEGMAKIPILPEVKVQAITALARGDGLEIREVHIATHIGTHMDAPSHAIAGGETIDQIDLNRVAGSAVVVPVSARAAEEISLQEVLDSGVEIEEGSIVLLDTGWAQQMAGEQYYQNPFLSQELADYLVAKQVKVLGLDCITVDMPTSKRPPGFTYPIHKTLLGNGTLIIENLGDLSAVSGKSGYVWAFPLKIRGGDAGHVRVVGDF